MHLAEEAGRKRGRGMKTGARFMTGEDTQKHAKLPLVRKWRGWYKNHRSRAAQTPMARLLCGGELCVISADLVCSAVDTLRQSACVRFEEDVWLSDGLY